MSIQWPSDSFADIFFDNSIYLGTDKRFIRLATSVFTRDNYQCYFCGHQCDPTIDCPNAFFQINAIDNNYRNLVESNLRTACPFCNAFTNLRAALRSNRYIAIKNSALDMKWLSLICKSIFSEMSSKKNALYDSANSVYKELESFAANITIPEFSTLQLSSDEGGDRARKARTTHVLNVIALSDGNNFKKQANDCLIGVLPLPRQQMFTDIGDFYNENVFSNLRKSDDILKLISRF
jgi:hypothetical protein